MKEGVVGVESLPIGFPGLKGGGVRGNRRFPGIYLQCGGLKNKICIFIINNGSH